MTRFEPLGGGIGAYIDDRCGFGADALLLADFARPSGWGTGRDREAVCDLGTGCGVLPLYWYTRPRSPDAPPIEAVEKHPEAAALAARSVRDNGLEARIRIHLADWNELEGLLPASGFDRVTCNPPYFVPGRGRTGPDGPRRLARQEGPEGLGGLARSAARLLKNRGRFCVCHRPERLADLFEALRRAGLEPKRLRFVHHHLRAAPFLVLCEARKNGRPGLLAEPPLLTGP